MVNGIQIKYFFGVTPICAFGIFVWFASLDIGSIKWINVIAGTTFGVYLIHDADILRTLYSSLADENILL